MIIMAWNPDTLRVSVRAVVMMNAMLKFACNGLVATWGYSTGISDPEQLRGVQVVADFPELCFELHIAFMSETYRRDRAPDRS